MRGRDEVTPVARQLSAAVTVVGVTLACLAGCTGAQAHSADAGAPDAGTFTVAWFRLDAGAGPFQRPWPSDLDRDDAGHPRFDAVPNSKRNTLVTQYVQLAQGRFDGFPTTGAVYFRLDDDLAPSSLPADYKSSQASDSALQIVDIDPASPTVGQRWPVQWRFQSEATPYWTPHTLAAAPAPGFPLRPHTRYATVLQRSAHDVHGNAVGPDADLAAALGSGSASAAQVQLRSFLAPALSALAQAGVAPERIAALSVLTTQDPTSEFFAAMDSMPGRAAPQLRDIQKLPTSGAMQLYSGHFGPVPDFQTGTTPYSTTGEGDFAFDDAGAPIAQAEEDLRFVLTVPTTACPDGGFPIAMYAHGTNGDAMSFVNDGTGDLLGGQGLATISFDQPFHGERTVGSSTFTRGSQYYNFVNPIALRRNIQVSALNMASLAAALPAIRIPAGLAAQGTALTLDGSRLVTFTHSQGSLGSALWLAASATDHAAVLSGAGGTPISAITQRTPDFDALSILAAVLGVAEDDEADLSPLAPIFTLLREFSDAGSPVNYARHFHQEPRPGLPPRSVFLTMGIGDTYVPDDEIGPLVVAARVPQVEPILVPYASYEALGLPSVALPLQGNLGSGAATGAWQQALPPAGRDGHFVIFDIPELGQRAARFLGEAAHGDGPPKLAP